MAYGRGTIPVGVIASHPAFDESQSNVLSFVVLLVVASPNLSLRDRTDLV